MGAVHGVYLKYVGLSVISYTGYRKVLNGAELSLLTLLDNESNQDLSSWRLLAAAILGYSAFVNGIVSALFRLKSGMFLIGKDPVTGKIPLWSYVIYFPFHLPTWFYTAVMKKGIISKLSNPVPVATEVQDGWWVGGRYAHELHKQWAGVVDLTVEFPETCINSTERYLLIASWDGVPASPDKLEEAANFAVEARRRGHILIHCAHGRGRSTTIMAAALVKAGLFETWEEAFERGIKPQRPVCKLNAKMRTNLAAWQKKYVDKKSA